MPRPGGVDWDGKSDFLLLTLQKDGVKVKRWSSGVTPSLSEHGVSTTGLRSDERGVHLL